MRKHGNRLLALITSAFSALALLITPARAETVEAVFRTDGERYTFTIDSDNLMALTAPNIGETYGNEIVFRNDTSADMKVTLVRVEELTSGTETYKRSYEHIYDSATDYYNGAMNDSAFETVLKAGESRTVHFDYTLDPEHAHKPDNALMGEVMKCRFTFVGEYDKQAQGTEAQTVQVTVNQMLDTDAGMLTVAAGAVCAAAGVALIVISKRRKKNAG